MATQQHQTAKLPIALEVVALVAPSPPLSLSEASTAESTSTTTHPPTHPPPPKMSQGLVGLELWQPHDDDEVLTIMMPLLIPVHILLTFLSL